LKSLGFATYLPIHHHNSSTLPLQLPVMASVKNLVFAIGINKEVVPLLRKFCEGEYIRGLIQGKSCSVTLQTPSQMGVGFSKKIKFKYEWETKS